ncbi:TPA: tungstate ABC transporter substrate-binding protein WtpA [bacterium]|nr:MAG: tungstate ABC transporter substrate-binding protein WtpA [Candidatus Hydrogenedentes bacterium CG07_land_8_20_14_0_80_42_17]HBW46368.1 tungstate ABC transporter substrate-binding protein WtpA [bacterium]
MVKLMIRKLGVVSLLFFLFVSCGKQNEKTKIVVFHAGSLSYPLKMIEKEFEAKYPQIDLLLESAGSVESARKISELGRRCDLFLSADIEIIQKILMPLHAEWALGFAGNEMVLAFGKNSAKYKNINENNWYHAILSHELQVGRADPNLDPCGYRTLMLFQLAERYYKMPNLSKKMIESIGEKNIRPKVVDLLALLDAGSIDCIFIYRSVAVQHDLKFIQLPAEINLGDPADSEIYSKSEIEISGKAPGESNTLHGSPIVYGVTIPKNAANKDGAELLLKFIFSERGKNIFKESGQNFISPPIVIGEKKP